MGGGEGGGKVARRQRPVAAARQAAPLLPDTTWKILQKENADTMTTTEGKTDETGVGEGPAGDLSGYVPTEEDRQIREVYEDWVHSNDGARPSGGVRDDKV